jgi:signal transduction histidine kinase
VVGASKILRNITEQKQIEERLKQRRERLEFLSEALGQLLNARNPSTIIQELLPKVAGHLGVDTYFNYMVDKDGKSLKLQAYGGVSEDVARSMERLEFGQAICGTVAETCRSVHATDIQRSDYDKASLVRSLGMQSYACNPLMAGDRLLGTLSFASRTRARFDAEDLQFLKIISQYIAVALERLKSAEDLENTVVERTASLREAVEQMEEFSYSVSHDLRGPLRAMDSYATVLLEEYGRQLDQTARGYINKIQRSSERMNRLTKEVLIYSRLARSEVELDTIDLERIVEDVIDQHKNLQSPAAEIKVVRPLLPVLGNETSLGQCVSNLLNNAVKFVAPGVRPQVIVSTERIGRRVRIRFKDNGIGIKPEYHERVFRMFERLHPDGEFEGTGVGLTIVRKAVEKMRGKIGIESDGVHGTCFWIELQPGEQLQAEGRLLVTSQRS